MRCNNGRVRWQPSLFGGATHVLQQIINELFSIWCVHLDFSRFKSEFESTGSQQNVLHDRFSASKHERRKDYIQAASCIVKMYCALAAQPQLPS